MANRFQSSYSQERFEEMIDRAGKLADDIRSTRTSIHETRKIPSRLGRRLVDDGFFRLLRPYAYGGLELEPVQAFDVIFSLAKINPVIGWIQMPNDCGMIEAYMKPDVVNKFNTPRSVYVWGPPQSSVTKQGFTATPTPDGTGYFLNGRNGFASGIDFPTAEIIVGAHINIEGMGIRTLLAPKADFIIHPKRWGTIDGMRGTASYDHEFKKDTFISNDCTILRDHPDTRIIDTKLYQLMSSFRMASVLFAACALGNMSLAIDEFEKAVRHKSRQGSVRSLDDKDRVQLDVGSAETRFKAAYKLMRGTLEDIWKDHDNVMSAEGNRAIHAAVSHCGNEMREVVLNLHHHVGADGEFSGGPLNIAKNDAHTMSSQAQCSLDWMEALGRHMLGGSYAKLMP